MENLVTLEGKQALTTSLKVAETFGKRHDNVLRDIENLLTGLSEIDESQLRLLKFEESVYVNAQNKQQKMYLLNRQAFTLLVMGYTSPKALAFKVAYSNAFDAMEEHIRTVGKSLLTTKEIALIHQMLVFFKYLDNCKHVQGMHEEMFIRSFYAYGSREPYEDLIKLWHRQYAKNQRDLQRLLPQKPTSALCS